MRKRKALLLFGGLTLVIVAYVAWCWRPFYVKAPTLVFAKEIDAETRRELERFLHEEGWEAEVLYEFEWGAAWDFLSRPYKVQAHLTQFRVQPNESAYDVLVGSQGGTFYTMDVIERTENGWKSISPQAD